MGCTISVLIVEIYLQSLEHTHIKPLLDTTYYPLHKIHRRHPHNLRHNPNQPRYRHTRRQQNTQQPRTLSHSRTKQQSQLP